MSSSTSLFLPGMQPRPKSPRQGGGGPQGFLAAERFHLAYKGGIDPNVRRRPSDIVAKSRRKPLIEATGPKRRPLKTTQTQIPTPATHVVKPKAPVLQASRVNQQQSAHNNQNGKTLQYTKAKGKLSETQQAGATSPIREFVKDSMRAKRQLRSCTNQVCDVYGQECDTKNNNDRGDNAMFFTIYPPDYIGHSKSTETTVDQPAKPKVPHKIRRNEDESVSSISHDLDGDQRRRSTATKPKRTAESGGLTTSSKNLGDAEDMNFRSKGRRPTESREGNEAPLEREAPASSSTEENIQGSGPGEYNDDGDDCNSLRQRRLLLFQRDGEGDTVPLARFSRVLGEVKHQDETIQSLQKEVLLYRKQLEMTTLELNQTRESCRQQNKTIADVRAKSLVERKSLEDKLNKVAQEGRILSTKMSAIQVEATRLRSQVRNMSKVEKNNETKPPAATKTSTTGTQTASASSIHSEPPVAVALRAEIIELRSQLAEAKESLQKSEKNAQQNKADAVKQQKRVQETEQQLLELRELKSKQRTENTDPVTTNATNEATKTVCESIDTMCETKHKLDAAQLREKLLAAQLEELANDLQQLKQENQKMQEDSQANKENLLKESRRLEESQVREKEWATQVEKLKHELQTAKREKESILVDSHAKREQILRETKRFEEDAMEQKHRAENEVRVRDVEIKALKTEVKRLSNKLESTVQELVSREAAFTTERNTLEDELAHSKGAVQVLQTKLSSLDERLADVEAEAELLREQVRSSNESRSTTPSSNFSLSRLFDITVMGGEERRNSPLSIGGADGAEQAEQLSRWEHQLKRSKANESVLASEVQILKELASNARSQADFERSKSMEIESNLKREIEALQSKVAEMECNKQLTVAKLDALSRNEDELLRCKAREQSLLNEIFELKTKLELYETQVKEERFRADEETRISHVNKVRYAAEIEKLKRELREVEKERISKEKEMRLKLTDLESRLKQAEQGSRQLRHIAAEDETEKRLRSELKATQIKLKEAQTRASEIQRKANESAKVNDAQLAKLRNELALMRARRVAEQKLEMREKDFESVNSTPFGTPDRASSVCLATPTRVSFSSGGSFDGRLSEKNSPPTDQQAKKLQDRKCPQIRPVRRDAVVSGGIGEVNTPNEYQNPQSPFVQSLSCQPDNSSYNHIPAATYRPHVGVLPAPCLSAISQSSNHRNLSADEASQTFSSIHRTGPHVRNLLKQPIDRFESHLVTTDQDRVLTGESLTRDMSSLASVRSASPRKGLAATPIGRDDTMIVPVEERRPSLDVAGFHRKLSESNKRLVDANSRLKGLVKASDDIMAEHVRIRGQCNNLLTMVGTRTSIELQGEDEQEDPGEIPQIAIRQRNVQHGAARRCLV